MSGVSYRLHLGGSPASEEHLDKFDSIEVSQRIDAAWQARLTVPVCLDDNGVWSDEEEEFMTAFSRVRVEIDPGNGSFVPLIDGVVVSRQAGRSNEPGSSEVTLVVHDDSVFLNRSAQVRRYENRSDSDIATEIYGGFSQIASTAIDQVTNSADSSRPREEMQRATPMVYLRDLARRNNMHAYVLPGQRPGESIGAFKRPPTRTDPDLPPLILPGTESNVAVSDHEFNAQAPARVTGSTLRICDKSEITETGTFTEERAFGTDDLLSGSDATEELLAPGTGDSANFRDRIRARAGATRWASTLSGTVRQGCYFAALQPYKAVEVRLGATSDSGNYLIKEVTHTLDRGSYQQRFVVVTDGAESPGGGSAIPELF